MHMLPCGFPCCVSFLCLCYKNVAWCAALPSLSWPSGGKVSPLAPHSFPGEEGAGRCPGEEEAGACRRAGLWGGQSAEPYLSVVLGNATISR